MRDTERDDIAPTVPGGPDTPATTSNDRPSRMRLDAVPHVPGYRIDRAIGEGGMGTVYEAEQLAPRRKVAIKLLDSRSPTALARFRAEAEIMAQLDHPSIARVLEAGDADGHPFLVMDYVAGTTLDHFVQSLPLAERLKLFVALCDAVHHAHVKGVIHRDLKPSNVMVREDGRIVVLDFGVARLLVAASAGSVDVTPGATRAGELIGTPLYMSPEQARLRADEVDVRSDVYTLGVMLYELACDELPYAGKDVPLPILTCMICEDAPIALRTRRPELAGDLEAIVMTALAKQPGERYQSVAALREDVEHWLAGAPVSVRAPTAMERARRFVTTRPVVAASLASAVLGVAAFAAIVTWLWLAASSARRTAEAATDRTEHARVELETHSNQLVLRQARAALATDPTEALRWLATLTPRGVDAETAWAIADEAIARGVAKDIVRGHADEVHWVEAMPGGFVTAGYDGRVIAWDPAQRPLFVGAGRVHAARPSAKGEIAIGGDRGALHVIDAHGRQLAELEGHAGDVQHLAWSRDGMVLASADDHGRVIVWPSGRTPAIPLVTSDSAIGSIAFAADDTHLAAGDHGGHVWLLDARHANVVATATAPAEIVEVWTDGARVVVVDAAGAVRTFTRDGARLVQITSVSTELAIKRAAFAPDGTSVVIGGVGGAVVRVALAGKPTIETLARFHGQVRSIAMSGDGNWLAAGGDDGSLIATERATGGRVFALRGHSGRVRHVAFAGGELLSSDSDGTVRRWDLAALPGTALDLRGEPAERIAATPTVVAWVDAAGEVGTWELVTQHVTRHGRVEGRTTALAIADDGTVITGTADGIVTWWLATPVRQPLHGAVKAIATRGDVVAIATSAGPIAMFTTAGVPRPALAGDPGGTEAVAIDPSGTVGVSGGQDRRVHVWRLADGTELAALDGPAGDTHFVAATDRFIVSAGNDGAVRAWARDGAAIDPHQRVIVEHTGAVTAIAVDGDHVVSAGRDATLADASLASPGTRVQQIATPAVAIAIGDHAIHVVTRAGAQLRWVAGATPVVELDHDVRDVARCSGSHHAISVADGTLVIESNESRSLVELHRTIADHVLFKTPRRIAQ